MKNYLLGFTALTMLVAGPALAQKAINTGGAQGNYHALFCPPIPPVLEQALFTGYTCTTSAGTVENIARVMKQPTDIGFVQLDVYAQQRASNPEVGQKTTVIRRDIACEGLFMVTKNESIKGYGDVLGLARRLTFLLPALGSGTTATFQTMQQSDPAGIGRASKITHNTQGVGANIDTVAAGKGEHVAFMVMFADPENAIIKKIDEKGLRVIPVLNRELLGTKIDGEELYQAQTFTFKAGGLFTSAKETMTACTPVAIITGSAAQFKDPNDAQEHKEMIEKVQKVPASVLLPKEGRIAKLMQGIKKVSGNVLEETFAAVDLAKKKAEEALRN